MRLQVGTLTINLQTLITNYVANAFTFWRGLVGINLIVDLTFSDGSEAMFKVEGIDGQGDFRLSIVSAVDSSGNNIPLTASAYNGTYSVSSGNSGAFNSAAQRNSVNVVNYGSDTSNGPKIVVTCSTTDGVTTCTYQYVY